MFKFDIDIVGKLVGLALSVLFCLFVGYALISGAIRQMGINEMRVFWAFVIILGGPIAYFFSNMLTKADLTTPVGRFSLGGGYVVAVLAVVLTNWQVTEPKSDPLSQTAWRHCVLNNTEVDDITDARIITVSILDANGEVFLKPILSQSQRVEFVCCFSAKQDKINVTITVPSRASMVKRLKKTIDRGDNSALVVLEN